jgi:membrane protein
VAEADIGNGIIPSMLGSRLGARLRRAAAQVADFPLYPTLLTLWQRLLQDRLGLTASSLTFTTVLALVPFFAVALSVFTAFPAFAHLQGALQQWLEGSLIPPGIAANVTGYLAQFAGKASQLGGGLRRPGGHRRVAAADHRQDLQPDLARQQPAAAGPARAGVLGRAHAGPAGAGRQPGHHLLRGHGRARLAAASAGRGGFALAALQFLLTTGAFTLLYRYVPNTPVRWPHAAVGALFVTVCLGLARQALGWYLTSVPTYSVIYGTFATLPILLLWIDLGWLIVLWGAVIAAYLPSLLGGPVRRASGPGWEFRLACEALRALAQARGAAEGGLTQPELARRLQVDPLALRPVLDALQALDWTGPLATSTENQLPRHVLLVEPARTPLAPLLDRLLLAPDPRLAAGWRDKPLEG